MIQSRDRTLPGEHGPCYALTNTRSTFFYSSFFFSLFFFVVASGFGSGSHSPVLALKTLVPAPSARIVTAKTWMPSVRGSVGSRQ